MSKFKGPPKCASCNRTMKGENYRHAAVTDDEVDAALAACGLLYEIVSVNEMRLALEGFAAGRVGLQPTCSATIEP